MSCCGAEEEQPYDLSKEIKAEDKSLLNCKAVDVNQLYPLKYNWAWEHYLNGCNNNWLPSEVPMAKDIELWRSDKLAPERAWLGTTSCWQFSSTSLTQKLASTCFAKPLKKRFTPIPFSILLTP